jgi:hypothetical protein
MANLIPIAKQGNLLLSTPKDLSIVFRVTLCALLYVSSALFRGVSNGVNKYLLQAYPLSPNK